MVIKDNIKNKMDETVTTNTHPSHKLVTAFLIENNGPK